MIIKDGIITSRVNPTVVRAASLAEKKFRDETGLFRIDGLKLAGEAFSSGIVPELILLRESSADRICGNFKKLPDCEALILSDDVFEKVSGEKSPEGIICILKHLDNFRKIATINKYNSLCEDWRQGRILLVEALRDPGNMGTVMRSALALGVDRLIISEDCADPYNPKTIRASMGAIFGIKVDEVDSLEASVKMLSCFGRRVFAAALDRTAEGLDGLSLQKTDCFVIGNEGHGLSRAVLDACNQKVFIPITEGAESLNAAAAAAILMWEQKRQITD